MAVTALDIEQPRRARWMLSKFDAKASPYLYISPYFLVFALVGAFPLIFTIWVSFRSWNLIGGDQGFAGTSNYEAVFGQPYFWTALGNTLSIFVLSVVPQLFLSTFIAVMLSSNLRAKTFWRMGVLLPYVLAPVAVTLIFGDLFGDRFGFINQVIATVGLGPIEWHVDTFASHVAIASMVNFRWTGYNALILLAAIQAVPQDFFDASRLDGAGRLRTFLSITLPIIRPTMIFVVVTATVGGLQIFDEPKLFSLDGNGGANNQWLTLTMYIYNLGWNQLNFGRASAVACVLLVLIIGIGLLSYGITRRLSQENERPRSAR